MKEYNRKLAKITKASLNIQDRGILTFWLTVDYEDGGSQGVGGIALDSYNKEVEDREGSAFGCEVIRQLLLCLGVDDFSQMKGKYIWVLGEGQGLGFTPRGVEALYVDNSNEPRVVWEEILEKFKE